MRVSVVPLVIGLLASASALEAQQGTQGAQTGRPREIRVVPRDTSVKPFFTGYSFRVASGNRPGSSGYPVITEVAHDSPAEQAGLKVGDELLSVAGFDWVSRPDSARFRGPGVAVPIRVRRGSDVLQLTLTPVPRPER